MTNTDGAVACVVERNDCTCHPETCCCADYGLLVEHDVVATGSKERMEKLASLINIPADSLAGLRAELEATQKDLYDYMQAATAEADEVDRRGVTIKQLRSTLAAVGALAIEWRSIAAQTWGESRHETAKRYLIGAESNTGEAAESQDTAALSAARDNKTST